MTRKPGITAALAFLTSAVWAIPDNPAQDQGLIASYLPVAAIARNGFVRDKGAVAEAQGREIRLWGFVDNPSSTIRPWISRFSGQIDPGK